MGSQLGGGLRSREGFFFFFFKLGKLTACGYADGSDSVERGKLQGKGE